MRIWLFALLTSFSCAVAQAEIPLAQNDTILFYGNSMVERLLEHGELEAWLQLAEPEKHLRVRSLAWTGDEVGWRARPEGYVEHLRTLLQKWPANVVVLGYGFFESFAGAHGLAEFRTQLEAYLREIERRHPRARLVLLSPIAMEKNSAIDSDARNRDLALYSAAISEASRVHRALFIDLFAATKTAFAQTSAPMTTLGFQLNDSGNHEVAKLIARALAGPAVVDGTPPANFQEVAKAAAEKSRRVADIVRPKNGVVYYGGRKRPEENAAEMPRYLQLIEQAEAKMHALVAHPGKRFADFPAPSFPPLPAGNSKADRFGGGVIKPASQQLKEFQVADGYAVNLFASEEQFPELRDPVQMAFDARGRLWVATMPSFPHTIPGEPPHDKILILEDTDRDGRADKCTVFADGFDALDGLAFHEQGLIVSAQPRLLLLRDTDGDDHVDEQRELLRGIDVTDSHHGGMVEVDPLGQVIFCDGVFHRSQLETPFGVVRGIDSTTYRLDPATGRIEREWQTMTPNPWKVAWNRYGDMFQHYGGGHVLEGLPLTWTPLGAYHPYGHATVLNYNKGCALDVISSPNFPPEYQQGIAQGTLLGSYFVSISKVSADGGPIVGTDRLDVLSSPNAAFRPVDIEFGFDGAMYVADFCSRIIGHAQHPMRDPQWNHTHGRIWRVLNKNRPLVRDWPDIEHAGTAELLALLTHPQNVIRQHACLRLRALGRELWPALDAWTSALDRGQPDFDQAALEALWIFAANGEARPQLLTELAASRDPLMRAAAVQVVRFIHGRLPGAAGFLTTMAADPHPRVRMSVISVVARLRGENPALEKAIEHLVHGDKTEPSVVQMLDDLKYGQKPLKGRSVPVLDVAPETRIARWIDAGETGTLEQSAYPNTKDKAAAKAGSLKTRSYRTFIEAQRPQSALLSVKHGYLDIGVNGVQLLSADSPYSSEQQVELALERGVNVIDIAFRRSKEMPPVFLFDPLGQPLADVHFSVDDAALRALAAVWDKAHAEDANTRRVRAVPNQMQFAPREIRVRAGQPVRLIFENPDLMLHNFVLVAAGAGEEVGGLADAMATQPGALEKNYIPATPKILQFTPLVKPNDRAELRFTAPAAPGRYPYLCTFPGHWRIMRGELVVE